MDAEIYELAYLEDWYHGELDRDQAERKLRACTYNSFLVRESKGASSLVLSIMWNRHAFHTKINVRSGNYSLQGLGHEEFGSLKKLVAHYQRYPIAGKIRTGRPCKNVSQGKKFHRAPVN